MILLDFNYERAGHVNGEPLHGDMVLAGISGDKAYIDNTPAYLRHFGDPASDNDSHSYMFSREDLLDVIRTHVSFIDGIDIQFLGACANLLERKYPPLALVKM